MTGIHYVFPDNSRVQYRSSRLLTDPPRVLADTGRPPRVWTGSRPCMGRVMREIGVPSPHHFSTHSSSLPPSLLLSSSIAAPKLLHCYFCLHRSAPLRSGRSWCRTCSRCSAALLLLLPSSLRNKRLKFKTAGSLGFRSRSCPLLLHCAPALVEFKK